MSTSLLEQEKVSALKEYIHGLKHDPGALMPIMQKAQEIFGHMDYDVQRIIAEEYDVPMTDVYGVATFYAQFTLQPKGQHVIGVCMGTACYVKSSQAILDALAEELDIEVGATTEDGLFTLEATRCLGCCGLAPVIMIGDDVFGRLVPGDIPGIIAKYRK
ncbi:MAG: NADH-quinone oxidoreductase subunit NuoE [Christensenellales bacterium]|jgi:NADH:ubiquinone oxidoreductase subunit E